MSPQQTIQWNYATGKARLGPVSDADLQQMLADRIVGPDTLVWRKGFTDWVAAASVFDFRTEGISTVVCAECGKPFPLSATVQLQGVNVCEGCKPVAVQKVMEGVRIGAFSAVGAWRDGRHVLTNNGAMLTAHCVKCNAPASRTLKRKLQWHHPTVYMLIPVGVLIYAIVAFFVRKTATITVGLCDTHHKRRMIDIAIFWLGLIGGFFMSVWGFSHDLAGVGIAGIFTALFCLFYGAIRMNVVTAHRISAEGQVWLKGVCKALRDSLPPS